MRRRLLDAAAFRGIRRVARRCRIAVAASVRHALCAMRRQEPPSDLRRKLDVIRAAVAHEGPTCDINGMLAEIGAGYLGKEPQ